MLPAMAAKRPATPVVRRATPADLDRVLTLVSQAFNIPRSSHEQIRQHLKLETIRVVESEGVIQATARALPFAHFFGGRSLPATGVAGVAVDPAARGKGLGTLLMHDLLGEIKASGSVISSLYPATAPLYKAAGYGFGAARTTWKVRLDRLPATRAPSLEPFTDADLEDVIAAYGAWAREHNGLVDRPHEWWGARVLLAQNYEPYSRYLIREGGEVTGWIIYKLMENKESWKSDITCRDLVWRTEAAARALLGFLALHRSTSEVAYWTGPPVESLQDLLPEDVIEHDGVFRSMIRLVDLPAAVEGRGYLPGVSTGVTIEVTDPVLTQNTGRWRIEIGGGKATCVPTDDEPGARLSIQSFAELWSNHMGVADLLRIGSMHADRDAANALTAMFAGPSPWIADFF